MTKKPNITTLLINTIKFDFRYSIIYQLFFFNPDKKPLAPILRNRIRYNLKSLNTPRGLPLKIQ